MRLIVEKCFASCRRSRSKDSGLAKSGSARGLKCAHRLQLRLQCSTSGYSTYLSTGGRVCRSDMALPEDSGRRKTSHVYLRRKVEKRWELQYHRSSSF